MERDPPAGETEDASGARERLTTAALRLPDVKLRSPHSGVPHRLRGGGRRAPLLILPHPAGCRACERFLRSLEEREEGIREWDGRPLVVVSGAVPEARVPASGRFPVLADPEGRVTAALRVGPPGVVVADAWGEVHLRHQAGEAHDFPTAAELVGWLRYLAIRCPECEGEAL